MPRFSLDTTADVGITAGQEVTVLRFESPALSADTPMRCDFAVGAGAHVLIPTYQGPFERRRLTDLEPFEFRGPGWRLGLPEGNRLSLPFVVLESAAGYELLGTDPSFMTQIGGFGDGLSLRWTYREAAGAHDQTRRIVHLVRPTLEEALDGWFDAATPDVPPGPAWLHEIALQDYDYMSKNGEGWFRDIDAAADMIAPQDRHRTLFTLHGWYDKCGRYCFDAERGALDDAWTVFPFMDSPELKARELAEQGENDHPRGYTFRNLASYHSLRMDWDNVRSRLEYARERGFRTAFYLITGLMDLGSRAEHVADGTGLDNETHLWVGPDAIGETYLMNPLHPQVRARLLALTDALLEKVGDLVDAMVIDEAYFIGNGDLGPTACPGYADQAQASLFQEIAARCHAFNPELALLSADHLGTQSLEPRAFPYCLFVDGDRKSVV